MRYAFHLLINENKLDEYDDRHKNVWEDLKSAIKRAGVKNYSIFRDGKHVFGYWECEDLEYTLKTLTSSPINSKWQTFMSDIILTPTEKRMSGGMKEVFHLD
ncbi:MAG: L-rhamnose mutarotase [Candidatus Micrarchaeaceae archaeon]